MILLILLGLLLRLSLLFLDYSWDVHNHISWAEDAWRHGFQGFYETQSTNVFAWLFPNYPPLSIFIFYLTYPLRDILFQLFWWLNLTIPFFPSKLIFFLNERVFLAAVMKIPGVLGDLGLAYIIYLFVKKHAPKNKRLLWLFPSLVLFNPVFIFHSSLWGQIDTLVLFFVLASSYLLLFTKKYILAMIIFTLSILLKPTPLVFAPVFIMYILKKYGVRKTVEAFFYSTIVFYISFLPFFQEGSFFLYPLQTYYFKIIEAQSLSYVTNGALNFWALLVGLQKGVTDTTPFFLNIPYRVWGYILVGLFSVSVCWKFIRSKITPQNFFIACFLISSFAVLFLTKMHERYTLLPLPFLLLYSINRLKDLRWYGAFSFLSLVNHYHSWSVPNIEFIRYAVTIPQIERLLSGLYLVLFLFLAKKTLYNKDHATHRRSTTSL